MSRPRKVVTEDREVTFVEAEETPNEAQEYANKVWAGQSMDLNPRERRRRVMAALEAQGLSTEGIKIG